MPLKIKDVINFMESIAPLNLKESYDNVGLMVGDREQELRGILLALDCTLEVIEEAKSKEVNMIITHHPLLFRKPSSVTMDTLQGRKLINLIKNDINLYSSHTNLDSAKDGMNDTIVKLLGFNSDKVRIIESSQSGILGTGIGRMVDMEESIDGNHICDIIKKRLNIPFMRYVGDLNKSIKSIAIINGSGQDYFEAARKMGADCIITGDTTYHYVSDYAEMGMLIFDINHFSSEWPLFIDIAKSIRDYVKAKDENIALYISENSKEPYNYI